MTPPTIIPAKPRVWRKRRASSPSSAPPTALVLMDAEYEEATWVWLTFDRPVDIGALDGAAIVLDDPLYQLRRYAGQGATSLTAPNIVQIGLTDAGPATGTIVTVSATAMSGMVAVGDGGTWAGVSDYPVEPE